MDMSDNRIVAIKFGYLGMVQCRAIVAKVIMFNAPNHATQGIIERVGDNVTEVPYRIVCNNHDLITVIINDEQPFISNLTHFIYNLPCVAFLLT